MFPWFGPAALIRIVNCVTATADPPNGHQCFLVEWYVSQAALDRAAEIAARLRESARAVSTGTEAVRLINLITIPTDDTCFGLFETASVDLVKHVFEHAAIDYERIVSAVQFIDHGEGAQ